MKHTIKISQKDVMRELRIRGASFENTVYNLTVKKEVEGVNEDKTPKTEVVAQYLVTPRQTHFSPGKLDELFHLSDCQFFSGAFVIAHMISLLCLAIL